MAIRNLRHIFMGVLRNNLFTNNMSNTFNLSLASDEGDDWGNVRQIGFVKSNGRLFRTTHKAAANDEVGNVKFYDKNRQNSGHPFGEAGQRYSS
jgi:hypothetical protein